MNYSDFLDGLETGLRDEIARAERETIREVSERLDMGRILSLYETKGMQEAVDELSYQYDAIVEAMTAERAEGEDSSTEKWLDNVERARAVRELA